MKHFLIHGTQKDNGHEYSIFSVISHSVLEPTWETCLLKLRQDNLFGYESEEEPGDEETCIEFDHVKEITTEDFEALKRLRVIY